jgi:hypothetical protein
VGVIVELSIEGELLKGTESAIALADPQAPMPTPFIAQT